MNNFFARLPIPHFFRWLLFEMALGASFLLLVPGLIWKTNVLNKTAYRTIDWLYILFVPVAGLFVTTRTNWRYCARTIYWAE